MLKIPIMFLCCLLLISCDYFKQDIQSLPIARVNETYLFKEDIKGLIFESTSKEDSLLIVSNFITRWATQQLLIDQAIINLPKDQQESFDKLVTDYKMELYTESYKSTIVTQQLDSTIVNEELEQFYELNKQNFRLNDELLKVRYIHIAANFTKLSEIKKKFKRYDARDKIELTDLSIKFKAFNLNDSIWIKNDVLLDALPILQANNNQVLKKSNFTELQDSLGLYLVKIEEVLKTNDIAPLSYVTPTIKQIILNKRKQELIKKLEKDITKDAIKNQRFELYKDN